MTVGTTSGTEKTVDQIVRLAYVMAGLLEETQTLADVGGGELGRTLLGTVLRRLQAKGITARSGSFETVACVADTFEYTMPATVQDVYGDAMYVNADETDLTRAAGELLVSQMSAEEWQVLSAKDATARPTRYFALRTGTPVVVRLWPIPDEAGHVRFQVHRFLADVSNGSSTVDLEAYWDGYLMHALAAELAEAKTMPADKIGRLKGQAKDDLRDAYAMSSERTDIQMHVRRSTSRRR